MHTVDHAKKKFTLSPINICEIKHVEFGHEKKTDLKSIEINVTLITSLTLLQLS